MRHARPQSLLLIWALALSMFGGPANPSLADEDNTALTAYLNQALSAEDGFEDRFAAEVWLIDMQQRLADFVPEHEDRLDLLNQVHAHASSLGLPPELVLSVIEVESHFDRFAVSRAGAQGLMQVMPFWKQEIGRPGDNLTHTRTNLRYGCHILRFYLDREEQDLTRALAAYNGSLESNRYPEKVHKAWKNRWRTAPLDW